MDNPAHALRREVRGCQSTLIRGYRQEDTIRPMETTMP
jgi:hypothetical protein